MSSPFAYVSGERQIHLRIGDEDVSLTQPPVMWGAWQYAGEGVRPAHTWPCWSPDGRHLACFRVRGSQDASVLVTDREGVSQAEVLALPSQLPIYMQWSGNGERLAVVSQEDQQLLLTATYAHDPGRERLVARGSPLFFSWTPSGRIAAFVGGGSPGARLMLLEAFGAGKSQVLPGVPGDFCAPVIAGDRLVYAVHRQGHALILAHDGEGVVREYTGGDGLLAFVVAPDGQRLARAVAPGGDGSPYQRLSVLDLDTGEERQLTDMSCLAFAWLPSGDALAVCRVDVERSLIEWFRVDMDGHSTHLVDMYPTRDMSFFLRFFEQYGQSHAIIDPTGQEMLVCGVLHGSDDSTPHVIRVPLSGRERPEVLAEGHFAVYAPDRGE